MTARFVALVACVLVACRPHAGSTEGSASSAPPAAKAVEETEPAPSTATPSASPTPVKDTVAQDVERRERLRHGGELYARMCAVCHGASGEGYKADQAPAIGRSEYLASVSDEFLRAAIVDGRRGSTMSAWGKARGGPLAPEDVDALLAFMRGWQTGPAVVLDEGQSRGNADAGAKLYAAECVRCHGVDGRAATAVQIGNPDWLRSASDGLVRHAIRTGRPGTTMEAFAAKLGDQGVEDVLAFVRRFQLQPLPPSAPPSPPPPLALGRVPLHPGGREPKGFRAHPETTPADVVHAELAKGAKMVLLDARAPTDYSHEHIAGAVSVPFYDPSPYLAKLPKHAWLVSYCACPHAESRELASKLVAAGFSKVTVLNEGLGYWKSKGYKTQAGSAQGKP